jgi:GNAT superfamily N-acetyltransferase
MRPSGGASPARPAPEKEPGSVEPTIQQGYFPGAVGRITEAHAVYYHCHWGFDASFEIQVATELAAFVAAWDRHRDGLWVAFMGDRLAGFIAIDGRQARTLGARLRWFLVLSEFHGAGIGTRLIQGAVEFCRQRNYPQIFLWTFQGLDAARRLYEKCGFALQISQTAPDEELPRPRLPSLPVPIKFRRPGGVDEASVAFAAAPAERIPIRARC